ncbi:ArnT family glycosyltransferase [Gloeobacter kilaueensis]|uniref:Glycosyl transferase family 39 n=1 Tax=Gloeobacter kilaueensis (strain ATCC BAA-2537 / CCAP 1431/1 / ULC 316 / JS1) TaxID=1183438 RepID=U5QGQ9_GLOK1|nr:glycosyltransferase family 39 protein [Gloeobacter kilaueensis]AGY58131.1 glycosyl transferase family 39 [Gloeobacter kilaueensis JS1]
MLQSSKRAPSIADVLSSLGLVGYTLPLLLVHPSSQSLIGADEGYYAQMAREMLRTHQWLGSVFLGGPWFEKPPLNQWLIAISFQLFGISEGSARLPSLLAAVAGVLLTYGIGRMLLAPRPAFVGALVLPTVYLWMFYGRMAVTDVLLTAIELAGLGCLLLATRTGRSLWAAGWGIAVGLGLLLKFTMVLLPAAATVPWLFWRQREHRLLTNRFLYAGLGLGLGLFGLWYWAASQVYGTVVYEQLFGHLFKLGRQEFHAVGPFYYLWNLPANTFPWLFSAIGGAWVLLRHRQKAAFLLVSYSACLLVLLQLFSTKESYYMLQVCPFLALLSGVWIEECLRGKANFPRTITSALLALFAAFLLTAVVLLILHPAWIAGAAPYLPLALVLGLCWLVVPVAALAWQRLKAAAPPIWTAALIGGPWLTLVLAGTAIGDFSPVFKAFTQQRLSSLIDPAQPIALVYENNGERVSEFIALAFYTPNPGGALDAARVQRDRIHSYWWLAPESRAQLDRLHFPYRPLAQVAGWTLAGRRAGR